MKISIITACLNSEKTIEKTIKSVIKQQDKNIEFILIDGKSKDHTMDIVNKYKDHFSVIISESDKGVADGFNKGVDIATGDLIVILNSDDELYPGAIEKIRKAYDEKTDIYYGDCIVIDEKNHSKCYQKAYKLDYMKYGLPCSHQSLYISKSCYEKFGHYSLKYKLCTDYDLIIKMYKGGAVFKYVNYPLCKYRQGGCTYVSPYKTNREDMEIAIKNGLGKPEALFHSIKYLFLGYGKFACEKLGIVKPIRRIRQKFNRNVSYCHE